MCIRDRYYTAEIVNALEHLHSLHIAHRDLKPENIMLDEQYKLKLIDFGTARFMNRESLASDIHRNTNVTFVGTPEYVSPEVLQDAVSGMQSDLWALGCIVFKFFAGRCPFGSASSFLMYEAIIKKNVEFPSGMPRKAVNLCKKLLVKDPFKRLGTGPKGSPLGFDALKKDEFFKGINFNKLKDSKPPINAFLIAKLKEEFKNNIVYDRISSDDEQDVKDSISYSTSIKEYASTKTTSKEEKKNKNTVIKEGIVKKKCGWIFYRHRKLILTDRPRLYYTLINGEHRGDILLTVDVRAEKGEGIRFFVVTPKRTYKLKAKNNQEAEDWTTAINNAIRNYCH
eukprot:TRINITY_DN12663_c0_g1_i3.p1 TRINITY_DN12663_c0_g1~~TRINITY_DN12663_c0_g1_i3.p1  ORF type:complete len:340 (+),score=61.52 TRINITY_DN12663_c0_g1_i3:74-1093(+)